MTGDGTRRNSSRLLQRAFVVSGAVAALVTFVSGAAAESCTYQLSEPGEPRRVLGSLVTPQSDSLVVAECGQTDEEVRAAIEAEKKAREQARLDAEARARERAASASVIADHEALMEWSAARDRARAEALASGPSVGAIAGVQELASDDLARIVTHCQGEWGSDYSMMEYCQNNQIKAARKINAIYPTIVSDPTHQEILTRCLDEWPSGRGHDWEMVEYCYDNQSTAYRRLTR